MTDRPPSSPAPVDPITELYARPGFLIRRAHQIAVGLFLDEVGPTSTATTTQYVSMVVLSALDDLDQISLAMRVGIDRSTAALVIKKLEGSAYIERGVDPQDRRRNVLRLTDAGREALASLAGPAARSRSRLLAAFSEAEADRLIHLLDNFVVAFNEDARAPFGRAESTTSGPLEGLYRRPGFLLRRAHQICVSLFLNELDDSAVTTTQYGVMVILRHYEGLDQIDLAQKVGLDRTTTALVVRKLEDKGFALRVADQQDRRRKINVLTGRGERALERLGPPARRARERALSMFSPSEAEEFLALLAKAVGHFNSQTRAPIHHDPATGSLGRDAAALPEV